MKKVILLITLIVGMTLFAGNASALTTASSLIRGDIFLNTLSITTTGSVTYGGFYDVTTYAVADTMDTDGNLTGDNPPVKTTSDIPTPTLNETTAGLPGLYYGAAKYDPVLVAPAPVDGTSIYTSDSRMFAEVDVTADDLGNDGAADAWVDVAGMIYGGAGGGTIEISFEYEFSMDLKTSSLGDYADGYSDVFLEFGKYTVVDGVTVWSEYGDVFEQMWRDVLNGDDLFEVFTGTLTLTQKYGIDEEGDYNFGVYSSGYAGLEEVVVTPEPSTYILLGTGIAGLIAWRRKRKLTA